jgi:hypothetical protein
MPFRVTLRVNPIELEIGKSMLFDVRNLEKLKGI